MRYEIQAFSEVMKNVICPTCDACPPVGEEARKLNVQKLRMENSVLKEAHERLSNEVTSMTGIPISHFLSLPPDSLECLLNSSAGSFLGQQSGSSSIPDIVFTKSQYPTAGNDLIEISEKDKEDIIQNAAQALSELADLVVAIDPLWVMSPTYGGYVLHYENYSKIFPKSRHLRSTSSRIESSRDSAVVPITASELVEMFLDMDKWADLFPSIVMEARIMDTLDTGCLGGSLHLMYERVHILSPLVAPREFFFIRYCQQLVPDTWLIVDASYDCFREIQDIPTTRSWRFPSGIMIESLPKGNSRVTWIDHIEVDASLNHPLYRDLLCSVHGYGARRWLSTLRRMSERSLYSVIPGGMILPEGKRNITTLSHRMIRDFCAILSMPDRLGLSESTNRKVRMSVRNNSEPGQPRGMIVAASTSIWFPLTFENLFNFLRDENRRPEWDLMLNRSPVNEIAHMSTGTHPGNCISILQPSIFREHNMLLLQENSVDPLGALVIFSTVDSQVIAAVMNGEDTRKIPILPCGFLISSDSGPDGKESDGASTSTSTMSRPLGSLLTLAFQLPAMGNLGSTQNHIEAANTLNTLVTSIIRSLKVALGCLELD